MPGPNSRDTGQPRPDTVETTVRKLIGETEGVRLMNLVIRMIHAGAATADSQHEHNKSELLREVKEQVLSKAMSDTDAARAALLTILERYEADDKYPLSNPNDAPQFLSGASKDES